jgi:hypothetical protein
MGEIAGVAADGMDNRRCPLLIANGGLGGGAIRITITIRIRSRMETDQDIDPIRAIRVIRSRKGCWI